MTLSGANADLRVPLKINEQKLVLLEIYKSLVGKNKISIKSDQVLSNKIDKIVKQTIAEIKSRKQGAVIVSGLKDEKYQSLVLEINEKIKKDKDAEIIAGGNYDGSKGYFIEPTVAITTNPDYYTMNQELFGPIVTIYIYQDKKWNDTLKLVDNTSEYALTGAVYSQDRYALEEALVALENSAGNFYINDKPTGAVVGQQPFGGARGSGTNDKAGSASNLLRWVSPRLIKETFVPATDYRYPFLG